MYKTNRYLFNVRTKTNAPVVVITGIEFYTYSTEEVNFELWSRIGNFQNFKGSVDGWDLISKGTVKGKGVGRYTSIPSTMFTPIDIPGGGDKSGTRAFYLTLDSVDLVYKTAQGSASDSMVQADTEEIELWEGEVSPGRYSPDVFGFLFVWPNSPHSFFIRVFCCTPCQT